MKKNLIFHLLISLILLIFTTGSPLFSSPKLNTCLETVENATMKSVIPRVKGDNGFSATATSKLLKKENIVLIYEIEVSLQYSNGASSEEFPSESYLVVAIGSEKSCDIILSPTYSKSESWKTIKHFFCTTP